MEKEICYKDEAGDVLAINIDNEQQAVFIEIRTEDHECYVSFTDHERLEDFIKELTILKEQMRVAKIKNIQG